MIPHDADTPDNVTECSSCCGEIETAAFLLANEHGWPTGEEQCLSCMSASVEHGCLADDEVDPEFMDALAEACHGGRS